MQGLKQKARYAAKWRWAVTRCNGPCKVRGVHLRGYQYCDKNPDPHMFGFVRKNGSDPIFSRRNTRRKMSKEQ